MLISRRDFIGLKDPAIDQLTEGLINAESRQSLINHARALDGHCSVHAAMMTAQKRMEEALAQQTILDLARKVGRKSGPAGARH